MSRSPAALEIGSPAGAPEGLLAARAARRGLAAVVTGALLIAFSPILVRVSELGPTATGFHRVFLALPLLAAWVVVDRRRVHLSTASDSPRRAHRSAAAGEGGLQAAAVSEAGPVPGAGRAAPVRLDRREAGAILLVGTLFAADLACWHWSLAWTTVANSTFLANLAPVPVALLAWLLFRERITPVFLLGMVVAIAGASMMVRTSLSLSTVHLRGDMLALATSVFYAGYLITVKGLRRRLSTVRLMLYSSAVSSVVLLGLSLAAGESLVPASLRGFLVLLALAWVAQVLGQGLIAYGLAHVPAGFSAVSLLLQPPAAVVLAWLLLGESVTWWQALGGAAVLVGILLARSGSRSSERRGAVRPT